MPAILGLRCPPGALQWEAGERLVDCELPSNFLTILAWTIGSDSSADRGCRSARHRDMSWATSSNFLALLPYSWVIDGRGALVGVLRG